MDRPTFEIVEGRRRNSRLLWVPEEKMLYSIKDVRGNGQKVYLCYHNIINKFPPCSARRFIDKNGVMISNTIPHSHHMNHEAVYKDLKTRSAIIDSCVQAATAMEGLHVPVPTEKIFTRELAK